MKFKIVFFCMFLAIPLVAMQPQQEKRTIRGPAKPLKELAVSKIAQKINTFADFTTYAKNQKMPSDLVCDLAKIVIKKEIVPLLDAFLIIDTGCPEQALLLKAYVTLVKNVRKGEGFKAKFYIAQQYVTSLAQWAHTDFEKSIFNFFNTYLHETEYNPTLTLMEQAISRRDLDAMQFLIDVKENLNVRPDQITLLGLMGISGGTESFLGLAAKNYADKIAAMLIEAGAQIERPQLPADMQPLYNALYFNNPEVADMLIKAGVDIYKKYPPSYDAAGPESIAEYFKRKRAEWPNVNGFELGLNILQKYMQPKESK